MYPYLRTTGDLFYPMRVILFLSFLSMAYMISRPPTKSRELELLSDNVPSVSSNLIQREWAEKAVRKYEEAQEKKWKRWNEAMFEKLES